MTRRRFLLAVLLVGVLTVFVVFGINSRSKPHKTVTIVGIDRCSKNIDSEIADHLGVTLYGYVIAANNYNQRASLEAYKATVRNDSCTQGPGNTTIGANNEKISIKTSGVIVDIPDAKQSWKITYDWVEHGDGGQTDLGTLRPTCLAADQLKYGAFNCDKALSIVKYGTANYDPILQYMPYDGEGFTLDYSPRTRQVIATIIIPADQQGNAELLQNSEAVIPYWFEHRGLDINKYSVTYRVTYQ